MADFPGYDAKRDLLFLPLGGAGEIGMNLNLYGLDGKWMMVDLGVTFAGDYFPGIDLILPDPGFIAERAKNLLAIVLTHGHEDHIGAVAHLWPQLQAPIYATRFTAGLVQKKLAELGIEDLAEVNIIEPGRKLDIGPFGVTYVPLAHSIAEGNGLKIETRHGTIFHTGDWKLDDEPLVGVPTPGGELAKLGDEGVLAMIGDSTNVFNVEASGSEGAVYDSMSRLIAAQKERVLVTTFASNVARLGTIGRIAREQGRSLVAVGRSMKRIIEVARECGYLEDFPPLVDEETAAVTPRRKILILATGCQGEGRAALARIARDDHPRLSLSEGDSVIFSSKIIPGNELAIGRLVNQLVARGIGVITEKDEFVHVSGHPGQPELRDMYAWIRPRIAVPVHGEIRHMARHGELARECGAEHIVNVINGNIVRLAPGEPCIVDTAPAGRMVLDGDLILPIESENVAERRRMMQTGHVVVSLALWEDDELAADPAITARGIPGWKDDGKLADHLMDVIETTLERAAKGHEPSKREISESVRIAVRRTLDIEIGKRPVVDVRVMRIEEEV